ncbi:hypothetical protein [Pseudomonas fluorescens]|uniref:hypothetical protein n=1 Tax=Pseudomonas fluorescens TaxID=294 RepID=UPI0013793767|nr:hypothetical protein [Pseudomonas fluorescens]
MANHGNRRPFAGFLFSAGCARREYSALQQATSFPCSIPFTSRIFAGFLKPVAMQERAWSQRHHISMVGMVLLPQLMSCPAVTWSPLLGFALYPARKPAITKAVYRIDFLKIMLVPAVGGIGTCAALIPVPGKGS